MSNETSRLRPRVAIVLAAGKGSRMHSSTPKVLHRAAGKELLEWVVETARASGCEKILVVVGHQREKVQGAIQGDDIVWVHQKEQKGTGHALAQAEPYVTEPSTLLVLSGDVPLVSRSTLQGLASAAEKSWGSMAVAELDEPGSLGRVLARESGDLDRIVEASDASPEELACRVVNAGIYALPSEIFAYLRNLRTDNQKGELYLTDALGDAARNGDPIALVELTNPSEAFGVNTRKDLARVQKALVERHLEELMESGVTILDPERTLVEATVRVGNDTVLHPGVSLMGHTRIGTNCEIHQGSWIRDSAVGDGVEIKPYSLLEEAEVAEDCTVGPFARLRPASVLLEGSRVGNFVELKKTRLGKGAKASHLTYLGDATIGDRANIGAGTITCNYDGANKHATVVGEGAFIGSDTMLVAPVEVGADAITGAGSTITHDVPQGALAIARARQKNITDWKSRARAGTSGSQASAPKKKE